MEEITYLQTDWLKIDKMKCIHIKQPESSSEFKFSCTSPLFNALIKYFWEHFPSLFTKVEVLYNISILFLCQQRLLLLLIFFL